MCHHTPLWQYPQDSGVRFRHLLYAWDAYQCRTLRRVYYDAGAIMAALGVLTSILGFDENMIGLMIALYIAMDSFGTACNVTGDGAIALVVNKIYKKR